MCLQCVQKGVHRFKRFSCCWLCSAFIARRMVIAIFLVGLACASPGRVSSLFCQLPLYPLFSIWSGCIFFINIIWNSRLFIIAKDEGTEHKRFVLKPVPVLHARAMQVSFLLSFSCYIDCLNFNNMEFHPHKLLTSIKVFVSHCPYAVMGVLLNVLTPRCVL